MISQYCQINYICPLPSSTSPRDFCRIWCLLSVLSFSSSSSFSWMAMLRTLARASSYNQSKIMSLVLLSFITSKKIFTVFADALFFWDLTVYILTLSLSAPASCCTKSLRAIRTASGSTSRALISPVLSNLIGDAPRDMR